MQQAARKTYLNQVKKHKLLYKALIPVILMVIVLAFMPFIASFLVKSMLFIIAILFLASIFKQAVYFLLGLSGIIAAIYFIVQLFSWNHLMKGDFFLHKRAVRREEKNLVDLGKVFFYSDGFFGHMGNLFLLYYTVSWYRVYRKGMIRC